MKQFPEKNKIEHDGNPHIGKIISHARLLPEAMKVAITNT
ncbi:MAG: hypothetical protein ACI9UV_002104 [Algoriphagus sp.]|jgi:hypothetical protein